MKQLNWSQMKKSASIFFKRCSTPFLGKFDETGESLQRPINTGFEYISALTPDSESGLLLRTNKRSNMKIRIISSEVYFVFVLFAGAAAWAAMNFSRAF